MAIYVVGSSRNLFPELDANRTKFIVDAPHQGDNIDALNPWYCELTALYWMWKNSDADLVGLEHYRRFFCSARSERSRMGSDEAADHLSRHQAIVTEYSHGPKYTAMQWFKDSGKIGDLNTFLGVNRDIATDITDYMSRHTLIQCNMFIARKEIIDDYCTWLFPRLKAYDEKAGLTDGNRRIDGYLSEHIFGLWLERHGVDTLKVPKVEIAYRQANGIPL